MTNHDLLSAFHAHAGWNSRYPHHYNPEDSEQFQRVLGDGKQLGLNFQYAVQAVPRGLADAFIVGKEFIGDDKVCLILGDNIFFGHGMPQVLRRAASQEKGATFSLIRCATPNAMAWLNSMIPAKPSVWRKNHRSQDPTLLFPVFIL